MAIKEWWNCSPEGQLRSFVGRNPNPFKRNKVSPLRRIPSGSDPKRIQPDLMHCMNLGFGKDLCRSSILLLCRYNCFGDYRSIGKKLEIAYGEFRLWCDQQHRTTSLKSFDLKTFKIKSQLRFFRCLTPNSQTSPSAPIATEATI